LNELSKKKLPLCPSSSLLIPGQGMIKKSWHLPSGNYIAHLIKNNGKHVIPFTLSWFAADPSLYKQFWTGYHCADVKKSKRKRRGGKKYRKKKQLSTTLTNRVPNTSSIPNKNTFSSQSNNENSSSFYNNDIQFKYFNGNNIFFTPFFPPPPT
jgi:hypothetical protein